MRSQPAAAPTEPLENRLAGLPPPVSRYLRLALGTRAEAPRWIELRQSGRLRTDTASQRWLDFSATHNATPLGCGFAWDAQVKIAPLLHVRVIDSLLRGRGAGRVLLQSIVPVGQDAGTPEMNSGSLHRFLAEAVWYPWALLPGERLKWEPVDDQRARATLSCHGIAVSLEFRFAPTGEVAGIYSEGRWGSFDGGYRKLPWEGAFTDYVRWNGVLTPRQGQVGWHRGGRFELVWQGTIESVRFAAAPA